MDWVKKTDSAGRSGINDYINAPQRVSSRQVRAKIGSLEEIVTSKIEGEATTDIKNNYGVFDNTLNVLANRTLFYNLNNSDKPLNIQIENNGEVFISNHTDSSGNADKNKALQFNENGDIILNGNIIAQNIDNSENNITVTGDLSVNNLYLVGSHGPQTVVNYDISGDASFNGRVFLNQGKYGSAKPVGIFLKDPSNLDIEQNQNNSKERAVQAILKDRFDSSHSDKKISKLSIAFGYDNSDNEQTELWFNRPKSDGTNNFGSLGLYGKPSLIAWNNKGGLSINNTGNCTDISNLMQDLSTCDISNSVTIRGSDADSGYIDTRGTLRIDSIKPNSAGASLVLVGKRSVHTESEGPGLTHADIIFKNKTDASVVADGNEKIHGLIKTILKNASHNSGDMIFYGQSKDSISSNTDSSGITEFMKYNASNETVHFPKIVSVGNSFDNSYGCIYPDPSAILDLRTFTEYGGADPDSSDFSTWQPGNVLLNCQNFNSNVGYNNVENGIVWQPLARNLGPGTLYSKESAAVKFIPEDDYFRGGLGFFTNSTGDESTDAKLRMKINQYGNVDICGGKVTINNFTSEGDPSGTLVDLSFIKQNGAFKIIEPNKVILKPTINQLILGDNSINKITYDGADTTAPTLTVESSNNRHEMARFQSNAEAAYVTVKNNVQTEAQIGVSGDSIFIKKYIGGGKIEFYSNSNKAMDIDNSADVNVMNKMIFKSQEAGLLFDNSLTIGPFTNASKTNLYLDNCGNIRIAPSEVTDKPKTLVHLMKNVNYSLNSSFSQGCLMHIGHDYSYVSSKYVIGFGPTKDANGQQRQFPAAFIGYEHANNENFGSGNLIFGVNDTGKDEEAKVAFRVNADGTVTFQSKLNLEDTIHKDALITGRVAIGVSGDFFTFNPEDDYPTEFTVSGDTIMHNKLTVSGDTFLASKLTVSGDIIGNVTGNVTGNLTGNVTGDITGDVTGNADTATKIASITNSNIVQLDDTQTLTNKTLTSPTITGTGEIAGTFTGDITGDVTGNADTATKIASITNSNIVQLDDTQTLTNKTLTSPTITGTGAIAGTFTGDITGNLTGNADTATKIASITNSNIVQLDDTQTLTKQNNFSYNYWYWSNSWYFHR